MSQPQPIIIDINQLYNPIYIELPMPTIILQIPSVGVLLSHELGNLHYNGSNNRCTHCGHSKAEEHEHDMDEEIDEDDMKEELVDEDDMKKEEIKEEMISKYPFNQQHDSDKCILHNNLNLNELPLPYLSEPNIKDEIYDWEQFSIDKVDEKCMKLESIISYLQHRITDQNNN